MLNSLHAVQLRGPATRRQWENLDNWFGNNKRVISPSEATKFLKSSDLIAVYQRPRSTIWSAVEKCATIPGKCAKITSKLILQFHATTTTTNDKISNPPSSNLSPTTHIFRVRRIDQFVAFSVITIGYILLFVPIWLEDIYRDTKVRIGIIMAFTALFAIFCVSATTSLTRGFETLAATAA
jgi:hypothetical protein